MSNLNPAPSIVFFASGSVGYSFLEHLVNSFIGDIAVVFVLKHDQPIIKLLEAFDVSCVIYQSENDYFDYLSDNNLSPTVGLLVWWPFLVSERLILSFSSFLVNTHPSMLPFNRGKHYNFWCLVEQCPFGVSLHIVDADIDTGPILFQAPISYDWLDTGESLYYKAQEAMKSLLIEHYPSIRVGNVNPIPQAKGLGSFHLSSEIESASRIDLDSPASAREIFNLVRARTFPGKPSCSFVDRGISYNVTISITKA